jgi:hypothetical protein
MLPPAPFLSLRVSISLYSLLPSSPPPQFNDAGIQVIPTTFPSTEKFVIIGETGVSGSLGRCATPSILEGPRRRLLPRAVEGRGCTS